VVTTRSTSDIYIYIKMAGGEGWPVKHNETYIDDGTFVAGDRSLLDPIMLDKRAAEWKFGVLDADGNGNLTRSEYGDLKKLVRKVIRPKRCSRAFIRMCDTNHDNALSKTEWTNCLSADGEPAATHTHIYIYTRTHSITSTRLWRRIYFEIYLNIKRTVPVKFR